MVRSNGDDLRRITGGGRREPKVRVRERERYRRIGGKISDDGQWDLARRVGLVGSWRASSAEVSVLHKIGRRAAGRNRLR
jgi:hypothetical protein